MAPPSKKPRGPSAYMIFAEEHRPEVHELLKGESADGKVPVTATAKAIGELWQKLSETDKEAYKEKAKQRAEAAAAAAPDDTAAGDQEDGNAAADCSSPAPPALPKNVVKRLMLADEEVQRVTADAVWLVAEAARVFLHRLAAKGAAAAAAKKRKTIKLEDFEHVVRCDKRLVEAGLKDVASNKQLFEQHGAAGPSAAGAKRKQAAADQQGEEQQQAGEDGEDAAGAEDGDAGDELTDEQRIEQEEQRQKKFADAAKARAAKAAQKKLAKAVELAKSTHKITTFFISKKPDNVAADA